LIACVVGQAFGIRPGLAIDHRNILGERFGYVSPPDAEHEDPISDRCARRIDNKGTCQLAVFAIRPAVSGAV